MINSRLLLRPFTKTFNAVSARFASHRILFRELKLTEFGEPTDGKLKLFERDQTVEIGRGQALLKMLATAINPADINVIQGKYGHLPKTLPATIGNEAVFEVLDVSSDNSDISIGDNVLLDNIGQGTWCSHLVADANKLIKVPKSLSIELKSTILVNPSTAFLMLREFVDLKPGLDSVLINAPTSQVGRSAIQIAKSKQIKTICVVRSNTDDRSRIEGLSPDFICSEEELRDKERWKSQRRPKLALNCVGGKTATDMLRVLAEAGIMVTYGGLSLQPLTIPTGSLIFRDQKFVGFWLSKWRLTNGTAKFSKIVNEIAEMAMEGRLEKPECTKFRLDDVQKAMESASSAQRKGKCLFVADN